MARAYLHDTAGDGDSIGASDYNAGLTYVAELDDPTEDPIALVETVLPRDAVHPDTVKFPGMVVDEYTQRKTESPLVWMVDVDFAFPGSGGFGIGIIPGAPSGGLQFNGWLVTTNIGEESVRLATDLSGKLVGPYAYEITTEGDPAAMWFAHTARGRVWLKRETAIGSLLYSKVAEGLATMQNASTLTLSKVLGSMTAKRLRAAQTYVPTCNSVKFLAWLPYEVLLRSIVVREQAAPIPVVGGRLGGTIPLVYPTELNFSIKLPTTAEPESWLTLKQFDTYRDAEGNTSRVFAILPPTGPDEPEREAPVTQTYLRSRRSNLYDVLTVLEGGGRPGTYGGGRP